MTLDFQDYEIENILKALEESYHKSLGKWEWQEKTKMYYYSPTKKSKQIRFTINSIKRQIKNKEESDE